MNVKSLIAAALPRAAEYARSRAAEMSTRIAAPLLVAVLAKWGAPAEVQAAVGPALDWLVATGVAAIAAMPEKGGA